MLSAIILFLVILLISVFFAIRLEGKEVLENIYVKKSGIAFIVGLATVLLAFSDNPDVNVISEVSERWRVSLFSIIPAMAVSGVIFPELYSNVRFISSSSLAIIRELSWAGLVLLLMGSIILLFIYI